MRLHGIALAALAIVTSVAAQDDKAQVDVVVGGGTAAVPKDLTLRARVTAITPAEPADRLAMGRRRPRRRARPRILLGSPAARRNMVPRPAGGLVHGQEVPVEALPHRRDRPGGKRIGTGGRSPPGRPVDRRRDGVRDRLAGEVRSRPSRLPVPTAERSESSSPPTGSRAARLPRIPPSSRNSPVSSTTPGGARPGWRASPRDRAPRSSES